MIWLCIILSIFVALEFFVINDFKGRIVSNEKMIDELTKSVLKNSSSMGNIAQHLSHTYILIDLLSEALIPGGPLEFFQKVRNNPNITREELLELKQKSAMFCLESMKHKISECLETVDDPIKRDRLKEVEERLEEANIMISTLDKDSSVEYSSQIKREISKIMIDIAKDLGPENLL